MITFKKMLGKYGRLGKQLFQNSYHNWICKKYGQKYDFPEWSYLKRFKHLFNHTQIETHTLLRESSEVDYVELPGYFPGMGNVEILVIFSLKSILRMLKRNLNKYFQRLILNSGQFVRRKLHKFTK